MKVSYQGMPSEMPQQGDESTTTTGKGDHDREGREFTRAAKSQLGVAL
jgi:hypothetical protein